jgi:tetratricopeptide (TPR) repeat protein
MRVFAFFALVCGVTAQQLPPTIAPAPTAPSSITQPTIEETLSAANAKYMHHDYQASLDLYEQARQSIEQTAPENPQRYEVLKRLAAVSGARGGYGAAIDYLQSAIQWRWDQISRDDPSVLIDRVQQVNLYRAMENYAQARVVLLAVMSKHQGLSGFRTIAMAEDYSLMGQIYMDEKNFPDAAEQLETTAAIRGAISGQLDVSLVPDLDRLGAVYLALHTYDKAESIFRRTLVIRESVLGSENADLLATLDGLAYSYFGQNKFDEAEPVYQRLVHLWAKSVGETHPMLALALDKVGIFYAAQKKNDQAREAFERANAIRANSLAAGLSMEAGHAREAGDLATAAALYARAVRVLDPPNPIYDAARTQAALYLETVENAMAAKAGAKKAATKK